MDDAFCHISVPEFGQRLSETSTRNTVMAKTCCWRITLPLNVILLGGFFAPLSGKPPRGARQSLENSTRGAEPPRERS